MVTLQVLASNLSTINQTTPMAAIQQPPAHILKIQMPPLHIRERLSNPRAAISKTNKALNSSSLT